VYVINLDALMKLTKGQEIYWFTYPDDNYGFLSSVELIRGTVTGEDEIYIHTDNGTLRKSDVEIFSSIEQAIDRMVMRAQEIDESYLPDEEEK
jgi:hypothetical protein